MLQRAQQIMVDRLHRQATGRALAVILLESLLLLASVSQLAETVRQLHAFVIDLKTLGYAVIFSAYLSQRGLRRREVIDKGRLVAANVRLNAHGEQQL